MRRKSAKLVFYTGLGSILRGPEVKTLIKQIVFRRKWQNACFLDVSAAEIHQKPTGELDFAEFNSRAANNALFSEVLRVPERPSKLSRRFFVF